MTTGAYITKWDLSLASECQLFLAVEFISPGVEVDIRAVFAATPESVLTGALLCGPVVVSTAGFYKSEWTGIPDEAKLAEVYVGFVLESATDVRALSIGAGQIQIR